MLTLLLIRGYPVVQRIFQVGNSSEVIKYPAKCFSWSWSKSYGDESLHQNAAKLKTLHRWIATDPHLDDSGDLRGRASLLRICLGLGILLGDACRALFTEENQHAPGTPGYLTASIWGPSDYDALMDYTKQLEKELLKDLEVSRCVNEVSAQRAFFLNIHSY